MRFLLFSRLKRIITYSKNGGIAIAFDIANILNVLLTKHPLFSLISKFLVNGRAIRKANNNGYSIVLFYLILTFL